jgi:hypothetical protein
VCVISALNTKNAVRQPNNPRHRRGSGWVDKNALSRFLPVKLHIRLHDLGWLLFVGVVSTAVVQAILIALAILRHAHDDPILPRWIGYRCLWSAIAFMPPGLIVFFKSGMLAWNGVISWWVLLASFAFWVLLLAYGLLRHAIPHQLRHENAAA